jgi:hypothetical protein
MGGWLSDKIVYVNAGILTLAYEFVNTVKCQQDMLHMERLPKKCCVIPKCFLLNFMFPSDCIGCQNVSESTSHYMQKPALQILAIELSIG